MRRTYTRLLTVAFAGSALAPLVTIASSRYILAGVFPWGSLPGYALFAVEVMVA